MGQGTFSKKFPLWAVNRRTGLEVHAANHGPNWRCNGRPYAPFGQQTNGYPLNGKLMLDYIGNVMTFGGAIKQQQMGNGRDSTSLVATLSLGGNRRVELTFGKGVDQTRYFTEYASQEVYHTF